MCEGHVELVKSSRQSLNCFNSIMLGLVQKTIKTRTEFVCSLPVSL